MLIVPDGAGGDPLDAVVAQDSEPLAETANVTQPPRRRCPLWSVERRQSMTPETQQTYASRTQIPQGHSKRHAATHDVSFGREVW